MRGGSRPFRADPVLVGRADEVTALDAFVSDAVPEPRALLIDGEPGIGKTTLLRELLGIAQERGYAVPSCRPSRSELDLSYAGLVELLGGVAGDVLDALPAPQARVLKVLLRREEPGAACAHASELVEALVGLGELAEAGLVLARFEDEAATSGGQWSVAAAARCRALLLAAEGTWTVAAVRRSLSLFDGLPLAFERARTLFTVGQIHRRRREKGLARRALADALAAFGDLGTLVWAGRARAELARVPVRRPADGHDPSGLTPTEERIARLAVEGLTNREIADRTFLSPKTVEVNLTRVYRKLGVRSRAVLASRLAGERDG